MNSELKTMLVALFGFVKLILDLVEKKGLAQNLQDLEAIAFQLPGMIANFNNVQAEVEGLVKPENLADVLAFITTQFSSVDSDMKAKAILDASLKIASDLAVDGYGLFKAIKG